MLWEELNWAEFEKIVPEKRDAAILPVGTIEGQILERWTRDGDDFTCDRAAPVCFVPLLGSYGWEHDARLDSVKRNP